MEVNAYDKKSGKVKSVYKKEKGDWNAAKNGHPRLDPTFTDLILHPKSEKVSRPPNAFMLFARQHRKSLAVQNPQQSNKVISSMLGKCWKKMESASKAQYFEQAKMIQKLHKQQHPGYVYSPRIARMQKLEKQKNRKLKTNPKKVKTESNKQTKTLPVGNEIEAPQAVADYIMSLPVPESSEDLKPSTPEYVPNNPLYFLKAAPEESHQEGTETASLASEYQAPSQQHPLKWHSPPSFLPTTSPAKSPEEFGMPPFLNSYYQRHARQHPCSCDERRALSCAPPMYPRWNPYAMDCMNEYGPMSSSFNRSRSSDPSSGHPVYKNHLFAPYQHYTSSPFENTPRFQHDPFYDCKPSFCSMPPHYMKWKNSYEDQDRSFYRNSGNIQNQQHEQWFADNRYRYSNPTAQPTSKKNSLSPRPEMKQGQQYFKYSEFSQYRDLDSNTLHSRQNISKSSSSLRSERTDVSDDMANISIPQFVTKCKLPCFQELNSSGFSDNCPPMEVNNLTKQKSCQKLESAGLSQRDQVNDYEQNPFELNPEKNESNHFQGNVLPYVSYSTESQSHNLESSDPSANIAYYVSYDPDTSSQGFVYQNVCHSDDELINVVDVEEIPQSCNNEMKDVLEENTDTLTEKPAQ